MSDDENGVFLDHQEPNPLKFPANEEITNIKNPFFNKPKRQQSSVGHPDVHCITSWWRNKQSKLVVSQQLEKLLVSQEQNFDLSILSILGDGRTGKSFLVDSLLSSMQNKTIRCMGKQTKGVISTPSLLIKGNNQNQVLMLDSNGQIGDEQFVLLYFLSSTIIYNVQNKQFEDELLRHLTYVSGSVDSQNEDLSLPQLILVFRDSHPSSRLQINSTINRINEYQLFDPEILCVNLPYPGCESVKTKQLMDVPDKVLNPQYLKEVGELLKIIRNTKVKEIKGNIINSKILSLTLDPLTKSLNKDHRISITNIWGEVIESLSIGFYNFYIMSYSEQLQKQFQNEKPVDQYTLYKRLSSVKRTIDKRIEGFNNVSGDPIFEKYKNKLREAIQTKQTMIRQINKSKSRQINEKLCKMLFEKMNESNYQEIIDSYCSQSVENDQTQALVQNFEKVINAKEGVPKLQKDRSNLNVRNDQTIDLEEEIRSLQGKIRKQTQTKQGVKYDLQKMKISIKSKEKEYEMLQAQIEKQKKLSGSESKVKTQQISNLEDKIDNLKVKISGQEQEINRLKAKREEKIRQATNIFNLQLNNEQKKLTQIQDLIKKAKLQIPIDPKKDKKDGCCQIM